MKGLNVENVKIREYGQSGATKALGTPMLIGGIVVFGAFCALAGNYFLAKTPTPFVQQACLYFNPDGSCNYNFQAGGAVTPQPYQAVASELPIAKLSLVAQEKHSGSYTATNGTVSAKFYAPGADITNPTISAIDTATFTSGKANSSSNILITGRPYKLVLDGGSDTRGWYSIVKDNFVIPTSSYNEYLGQATVIFDERSNPDLMPVKIGTMTVTATKDSASEAGITQTNTSGSEKILYNITAGDGTFTMQYVIQNTASNTELRNMVLDFENDQTTPLEGDEYSAVSYSYVSGKDFSQIGGFNTNMLSYVTSFSQVPFGTMLGADQGTFKITYGVVTATSTDGETLHQYFDDLGMYRGMSALPANRGVSAIDWKIEIDV